MKIRFGIMDASFPVRGGRYPTFGEHPFDDVRPRNPLLGTRVMDIPEHALLHAAAIGMLPAWDRYLSHLIPKGLGPASPASHAFSALRRLKRVILQVERSSILTSRVPSLEDSDELLDLVILAFVHLSGAFDALALVASDVTSVKPSWGQVAWQNGKFITPLDGVAPALAALVQPHAHGARSLAAIRTIRNTVHGQMPDPAQSHRDGGDPAHDHTVIVFERDAHDKVFKALDSAGWSKFIFTPAVHPESLRGAKRVDISGVSRTSGLLLIRPEYLLGAALRDAIPLVNAIMAATPVERMGKPVALSDPGTSLFPISLQQYAVSKFRLTHLAPTLGTLSDVEDGTAGTC